MIGKTLEETELGQACEFDEPREHAPLNPNVKHFTRPEPLPWGILQEGDVAHLRRSSIVNGVFRGSERKVIFTEAEPPQREVDGNAVQDWAYITRKDIEEYETYIRAGVIKYPEVLIGIERTRAEQAEVEERAEEATTDS